MAARKALTLSIVIPVYNEENHLGACLEAIAVQTVAPDEVLIVDNNANKATRTIAESYPFVKVLKEKRQGIAYARDRGFNAVRNDLIGRIDGDTILPPDWVARVKSYYREPENLQKALTGGGWFYNVRWPRFNGWVQSQLAYRLNRFIIGHYILWGSNMALPRELWAAVKTETCAYPELHEDLDLAIHLHRLGYQTEYQATLQVGVYLKRVLENRDQLNEHISRWPATLKGHGFKRWWLSLLGNILLKYLVQPFAFATEGVARLFGRTK